MTIGRIMNSLPVAALAIGSLARQFTPEVLVQTNRLSGSVAVSPSSSSIAYIQTRYSIEDKRQTTQLFIQKLDSNDASETHQVADFSVDARPNPPKPDSQDSQDADSSDTVKTKKLKPSQPVWLSDSSLGFV
ncbi:hypothetical protein IW150_007038, partial [Coemansia sp. RSA 2607]